MHVEKGIHRDIRENTYKKYKKVENRLRNTRKRLKGSRKETSSPAHKSRTVRVKFAK